MKCPVCGSEMKAGGLWVTGTLVRWLPEESFKKNTILNMFFPDAKVLSGKTNHFTRETKVPNAHYCENCRKIIGVFDLDE
ncbi:MAG: hypothetical protein J6I98_03855 [Clostridia bacterium]|nr:hypothetical protein [Clostridia bacterium]